MRNIILICVSLTLTCPCLARTITVDDDGPADFTNIQAAIDDASDGDTVLVKDGTYTGQGNRDIDFLGKAITVKSENGPENCIIDCNGSPDEPHRSFYFHSGEDTNSILKGFYITNGNSYYKGAGIHCLHANPIITNCIIKNNTSEDGAAVFCEASSSLISNCTIIENIGSGIYSSGGTMISNCIVNNNTDVGLRCHDGVIIINCTVKGNNDDGIAAADTMINECIVSGNRFGIWCLDNTTIQNSILTGNITDGINIQGRNSKIINSIITGNKERGISCHYEHNARVANCTVSENLNEGVYCNGSTMTLENCIVFGNQGTEIYVGGNEYWTGRLNILYTNVQGGEESIDVGFYGTFQWGLGNISANPFFVAPDNNDYHLQYSSPCIDAGDPNYIPEANETDLDGNPRVVNGRIDMGAYEYLPPVQVELKLTPQMLNCESRGKWVKAHVTLPEEIYFEDIDVNTPAVADPPGVESEFIEVNKYPDGQFEVQIYFGRQGFCEALSETEDGFLDIMVTGSFIDGSTFEGSDTIKLNFRPRQQHQRRRLRTSKD